MVRKPGDRTVRQPAKTMRKENEKSVRQTILAGTITAIADGSPRPMTISTAVFPPCFFRCFMAGDCSPMQGNRGEWNYSGEAGETTQNVRETV